MRRLDKQISDPELIEEIFQKGTVVHVAMLDGNKPYQVPLNYGYERNILYIHSARAGKKIDLLRKNNRVHFQIETGVEVKNTDQAYRCGTNYECVMGYGKATIIDDPKEKKIAADILMNHYRKGWGHYHKYKGCLTEVFIIRIDIDTDTVTGKKSEDKHMDVDVERFEREDNKALTTASITKAPDLSGNSQTIKVVINGMLMDVEKRIYSFDEIVALAFKNSSNQENTAFTVSYLTEDGGGTEKSIIQGDALEMKAWMRFNVFHASET